MSLPLPRWEDSRAPCVCGPTTPPSPEALGGTCPPRESRELSGDPLCALGDLGEERGEEGLAEATAVSVAWDHAPL